MDDKSLERTKKYTVDSDLALFEEISDVSDSIDSIAKTLKSTFGGIDMVRVKGERGEKGDKGETGKNGKDGKDGKNGKDGKDGRNGIDGLPGEKGKDGRDGKDGSADMAEEILEKLRKLPKGKRLKLADIDDIERLMSQQVQSQGRGLRGIWAGSANPFVVKSAGVEMGRDIRSINFQGAGVSSVTNNNGDVTVTIQTGSSGYTKETPVGTVNGTNVTFTVTATPVYIVSDGTTYFDGAGYSISGLTVTMTVPPIDFLRSFY